MDNSDRYREVTKKEFFEVINKLNVHPRPEGRPPYTSYFLHVSSRIEAGKIENGDHTKPSKYFLVNK